MELSEFIEAPRVHDAFMRKGPRPSQVGDICIFGHHLIFAPSNPQNDTTNQNLNNEEFWLLHKAVDRVLCEPISKEQPSKGGLLALKCKNFLIIIFEISDLELCRAAARSIESLSNLNGVVHDYAFFYNSPFTILDDGWTAFNPEQEFARLMTFSDNFRISSVNENFSICPSYPDKVIVPKGIGDDYLKISATFRDGGRFPVLSYFHKETKSPLIRCGQPLIGPTNRRCREDETILNSLLTVNRGFIIDTRTKTAATSAKAKGGGSEPQGNYRQWKYLHCPIPKMRDIHDALTKIVDACSDRKISSDRWVNRIASSGWLSAVAASLECAANAAQCIHCEGTKEVPVVIHGGEGTDTTLIACALAQVILDTDARTIRGLESVIEREWICAGHPFSLRNAHCAYAEGTITGPFESPVFLVFLDCLFQMVSQYPLSFEYDESFLIFLFEHAYASEFGSFVGNNEKEKQEYQVKQKTVSLWSHVHHPETLKQFVNPCYDPEPGVLWPSIAPQSIKIWERLFFRWQRRESNWSSQETETIQKLAEHWQLREKELISKASFLRRSVAELTKELRSLGVPTS
ncbi:unnamed protein product [Caenorhabditis bovis]|uniref:Myotubularin phosphatase domain-containing protein n=1 Tax=Caenorhabditis bovis TaxID=2654633 RepID=A0A8S1EDW8_9PELO|nr:unnamed protein product [Caenorhabditis bovis]